MSMEYFNEVAERYTRMKDQMHADELSTEGCVALAAEVLRGAAEELAEAAVQYHRAPSKESYAHLRVCRNFYSSELFQMFSGGVADGPQAARVIIRKALANHQEDLGVLMYVV